MRAATGWDVSDYELMKVGERALTLARVFNTREGFTAADDQLAERTYGPTTPRRAGRGRHRPRGAAARPCTPTMA